MKKTLFATLVSLLFGFLFAHAQYAIIGGSTNNPSTVTIGGLTGRTFGLSGTGVSTSAGPNTITFTSGLGSVSTSSGITANYFPYWVTATGGLNGTSSLAKTASGLAVGTTTDYGLFSVVSTTPLLVVSSTGNVGIGITNPSSVLHVVGTALFSTTLNASGTISQSGTAVALQNRNINTTSPVTGGGDLSADRTIACATCVTSVTASGVLSSSGGTTPAITFTNPGFVTVASTTTWTAAMTIDPTILFTFGRATSTSATSTLGISLVSSTQLSVGGTSNLQGQANFNGNVTIDPTKTFTFGLATSTSATSSLSVANASTSRLDVGGLATFGSATIRGDKVSTSTPASSSIPFVLESMTASEDDYMMTFMQTSTVQRIYAANKNATDTMTINVIHNTNPNSGTTTSSQIFASNQLVNATSIISCYANVTTTDCATGVFGALSSTTVNTGETMRFINTATVSSTGSQFRMTVWYTTP